MSRLNKTKKQRELRSQRVRKIIRGDSKRPRLSVFISNHHISAQIIDDSTSKTLVYATTVGKKENNANLSEKAAQVGSDIAKKAKLVKVTSVVFDRGSQKYHGRIKALADAARENGLEF
ncbi:MAG TPA: 50S ribosomal protein L18 [Candidatus Saccharimonadia bacterium]|nr:50S ribosomal protein L18 [Candidatus Saccharimonadia bacterium]